MKLLKATITISLVAAISQVCYAFSKPPKIDVDICPAENAIQQVGQTYTAPGGWTGVVQHHPGKVKIFEMALYKPTDTAKPFKAGELLRCSYKLDNGNSLDLRLPDALHSPGVNNKAHITHSKNWESAYHGYQYDCSTSRLACEFNLINKS